METRQIKSSLKHVASYVRPFRKVPRRFCLYLLYTNLYIPLQIVGDNFW